MLEIRLPGQRTTFEPGETIELEVSWSLNEPAQSIALRLLWSTIGKGDRDLSVEQSWQYDEPLSNDDRTERVILPAAPYSFSGKVVSLLWAFELIELPGGESTRQEITIAPGSKEVLLHTFSDELT